MRKVARPRIVTKERLDTTGLPEHVQVALAEIADAAREGVLALSVACGLQVVSEMLAADVARICGPKGKHDADRVAYRHGTETWPAWRRGDPKCWSTLNESFAR